MISPNDPQFLDQFGNHSDFPGCHCSVSLFFNHFDHGSKQGQKSIFSFSIMKAIQAGGAGRQLDRAVKVAAQKSHSIHSTLPFPLFVLHVRSISPCTENRSTHAAWARRSVVVLLFSMLHGVYLYKKLNKNILSTTRSIQFSLFSLFLPPPTCLESRASAFCVPHKHACHSPCSTPPIRPRPLLNHSHLSPPLYTCSHVSRFVYKHHSFFSLPDSPASIHLSLASFSHTRFRPWKRKQLAKPSCRPRSFSLSEWRSARAREVVAHWHCQCVVTEGGRVKGRPPHR
jgi:hypothetical protein